MKKLALILILSTLLFAKSNFSEPHPMFENPRKLVLQMYQGDLKTVNRNLGAMYNILKEYPAESLKIVVILYGAGMKAIKKDYDKKTLLRIKSLMQYDVEFIGCRNTMKSMHWLENDFIEDVSFVQAGIVELIERDVSGYTVIRAF